MGRIEKTDDKPAEKKVEEDPPIVKQLKELDDKYLAIEKEYDAEVQKLLIQYTEKQQPLLDERKAVLLAKADGDNDTGTPAIAGFWRTALKNHPAFEDTIQNWDEPVLDFLQDIEKYHLDDADSSKGFKLVFKFAPNPYFEHTELVKEYVTEIENPYYSEIDVKEIKCTEIVWKEGKDVTIAKVAKKVKGGGAKKAKQKKEKEEPRASIFRDFFRSLSQESKLTEEMRTRCRAMGMMEDDDSDEDEEDDEQILEYLMDADHQIGQAVRDNIIPFAVRWYTGEAAPDDDDDEWFGDEDEEEEEETDEEDEEDESASPKAKVKGKGKGKGKKKEAAQEECKQQ